MEVYEIGMCMQWRHLLNIDIICCLLYLEITLRKLIDVWRTRYKADTLSGYEGDNSMNLIVAIDKENGIGLHGDQLYRIPEDLKYFQKMTIGKVVVMGHSTLKALPGAGPLPGRGNIVLTSRENVTIDGCIVCRSLRELFESIAPYESGDVFVIGGESVYKQLLEYCSLAYVTKIDCASPADRFFPKLEEEKHWVLVSESEEREYEGLRFRYQVFENLAVKEVV